LWFGVTSNVSAKNVEAIVFAFGDEVWTGDSGSEVFFIDVFVVEANVPLRPDGFCN
jgi:hypothetical protein